MLTKFVKFLLYYRRYAGFIFAVLVVLFSKPEIYSIFTGLIFVMVGVIVRTWASGYIKKNEVLTTCGPYAYTRNPLYFGSFITALGAVISANNWILFLVYPFLFFLIYIRGMKEEEEYLLNKFGKDFEDYKKSVPLFFPVFKKYKNAKSGKFSFKLVLKHGEYNFYLGVIAIYIYFFLKLKFNFWDWSDVALCIFR